MVSGLRWGRILLGDREKSLVTIQSLSQVNSVLHSTNGPPTRDKKWIYSSQQHLSLEAKMYLTIIYIEDQHHPIQKATNSIFIQNLIPKNSRISLQIHHMRLSLEEYYGTRLIWR